MDVEGGSHAKGTKIWLHPFNGSKAQNFKFNDGNGNRMESHVGNLWNVKQKFLDAHGMENNANLKIENGHGAQ